MKGGRRKDFVAKKALRMPLENLTVLDLTEVWAGPMASSLLGDLGARVIKVESYPRVSITRAAGNPANRGYSNNDPNAPRPWDRAAIHNMANRNKLGITLNLTHPKGLEIFKSLVKLSHVLIESFSGTTGQKLGIHYEAMKEVKQDIIMVSMPGWGVKGPYKGYVSLGSVLDSFTGHHFLRGYPETDPTVTPLVQHVDAIAAVTLPLAVLVAYYHYTATGEGQWIDLSQVESFLPHLSRPIMDYAMNKRLPRPLGNRDYFRAPHGCYRCVGEDNWVVICITSEEEWRTLCQVMGDPSWTKSKKYNTNQNRYINQDAMDSLIEEWTRLKGKKEVMVLLQQAGVPACAVLDDEDIYSDPHLKARRFFERIEHRWAGAHSYPGFLWKFSKMYEPVRLPPNSLGEHNHYVFGTILGMNKEEIKALYEQGIISDGILSTGEE